MFTGETSTIWKRKWGYSPLLVETFCDIERTYPLLIAISR